MLQTHKDRVNILTSNDLKSENKNYSSKEYLEKDDNSNACEFQDDHQLSLFDDFPGESSAYSPEISPFGDDSKNFENCRDEMSLNGKEEIQEQWNSINTHKIYSSTKTYNKKKSRNIVYSSLNVQQSVCNLGDSIELLNNDTCNSTVNSNIKDSSYLSNMNDSLSQNVIVTDIPKVKNSSNLNKFKNGQCPKVRNVSEDDADLKTTKVQTDGSYCDSIETKKHAHITLVDFLENRHDFKKKLKNKKDVLHLNKIIAQVSSSVDSSIGSKMPKKERKKLKLLSAEKTSKSKSTTKISETKMLSIESIGSKMPKKERKKLKLLSAEKISKRKSTNKISETKMLSIEKDIDGITPKNDSENVSETSSVQNGLEFLHNNFINGTPNKNVSLPVKKQNSLIDMLKKINRNNKSTENLNAGSSELQENSKHNVFTKENNSNNISAKKTPEEGKEENDKFGNNNASCKKQLNFIDLFEKGETPWSSVQDWLYTGPNTVETFSSTNQTNSSLSPKIMEFSGTDNNREISCSVTSDACGLIKTLKSNNHKSTLTKQETDQSFSPKRTQATNECDTKEFLSLNSSESCDLIKTGRNHMQLSSSPDDSECSQFESIECSLATSKKQKKSHLFSPGKIYFGNQSSKKGLSGLNTSNKCDRAENNDSDNDVYSKEENLKSIMSTIKLRKKQESLLINSSDVDNYILSDNEISPEKQKHILLSPTEKECNKQTGKKSSLSNFSSSCNPVQSHEEIKLNTPIISPQSNTVKTASKNQKKCSSKLKSEQIDSSHATSSEVCNHIESIEGVKSSNKKNKKLCSSNKNNLNKIKMCPPDKKVLNKQKDKQKILSTLNSCNSLQSCEEIKTPRKRRSKSLPKVNPETNICHQNSSDIPDFFPFTASPLKACQKQNSSNMTSKVTSKRNRKSSVDLNIGEKCNDSPEKSLNNLQSTRKSPRLNSEKRSQSLNHASQINNKTSPQNKLMSKKKSKLSICYTKPLKRKRHNSMHVEDSPETEPNSKTKRNKAASFEISALSTFESTSNFKIPSRQNIPKSSRKLPKFKPRKRKSSPVSNFVDSNLSDRNVVKSGDTNQNSTADQLVLDANQNSVANKMPHVYYYLTTLPANSRVLYDPPTKTHILATLEPLSYPSQGMVTTGSHLNVQPQVPPFQVQESQNKIASCASPVVPHILCQSTDPKNIMPIVGQQNLPAIFNAANLRLITPQSSIPEGLSLVNMPQHTTTVIKTRTLSTTRTLDSTSLSQKVPISIRTVKDSIMSSPILHSTPLSKPNFQSHSVDCSVPSVSGLLDSNLLSKKVPISTHAEKENSHKILHSTPSSKPNLQSHSIDPSLPSVSGLQISKNFNKISSELSSNVQNAFTNRSYSNSVSPSTPEVQGIAEENSILNPVQYFNKTVSVTHEPFDWHCMVYRTSLVDPNSIYTLAKDIFSGKFCDFSVKDFFSDSFVYNGLSASLTETLSYPHEVCFAPHYKFPDSFLDEPLIQLLKDFVSFHVKRIYPQTLLEENRDKDIKTVFLTDLLKTSLSLGTYFSDILPFEKTDVTIEDLVECLTFAAIMCFFNEYKKRITVSH